MVFGSVSHLSFSNMVLTQCKHGEYEAEKKKHDEDVKTVEWRTTQGSISSGLKIRDFVLTSVFMVNYLKSEIKKK